MTVLVLFLCPFWLNPYCSPSLVNLKFLLSAQIAKTMITSPYQCFFSYFGLRENSFHVSPDPRFYYSTPTHDAARQELLYGLETRQGLLVLTGEAGTGKTTLVNAILESLARRNISTAYVFHPRLERIELFEFILRDFGVKFSPGRKGDLIRVLHEWLIARDAAGDRPVLVLDEAQALSMHTLDELRLLLNLENPTGKLLQIILAGQTELEAKLRRPELRQLRQRVMFHCKLSTLSEAETASYIQSRLLAGGLDTTELFPADTIECIHRHANGIPRVINLLCEHALITAYGEQQPIISADSIERIAIDFDLSARPIFVEPENFASRMTRRRWFPVVEPPPFSASELHGSGLTQNEVVDTRIKRDELEQTPVLQDRVEQAKSAAAGIGAQGFYEVRPIAGTRFAPASSATAAVFVAPTVANGHLVQGTATNHTASEYAIDDTWFAPEEARRPVGYASWLRRRPRHIVPRFVRQAVASGLEYVTEVGRSFIRDCSYFFRPNFRPVYSQQQPALTEVEKQQPTLQRTLILPVANWLRGPMKAGRPRQRVTRIAQRPPNNSPVS
jgi:general secretion pathway protein A